LKEFFLQKKFSLFFHPQEIFRKNIFAVFEGKLERSGNPERRAESFISDFGGVSILICFEVESQKNSFRKIFFAISKKI